VKTKSGTFRAAFTWPRAQYFQIDRPASKNCKTGSEKFSEIFVKLTKAGGVY
jgi:hypothetical protein